MAVPEYVPVLSPKAWEFLRSLSRRRQQRLTNLIYQLADQPIRLGDYQTRDSAGRSLQNLRIEGYIFTFWTDGAVNELRILDITEL
jgi:hypothetical protein